MTELSRMQTKAALSVQLVPVQTALTETSTRSWRNGSVGKSFATQVEHVAVIPGRGEAGGQLACVHRWKVHTQRKGQGQRQKDKQRQRECKNKQHTGKDVGKDRPLYIVSGNANYFSHYGSPSTN